jgi:tRNA nucleotidyltransferase (CCA-adding enzyme)
VPLSADTSVRFAALGAGSSQPGLAALCERLRAPNSHRELALLCVRLQQRIAAASALDGAGLLDLLDAADALRRPERFERLLCACTARGAAPDTASLLREAVAAAAAVALPRERMAQLNGPGIATALRAARLEQLERFQSERRRS